MASSLSQNNPDGLSNFLFPYSRKDSHFVSKGFERVELTSNSFYSQLVDIHSDRGMQIGYLQIKLEQASKETVIPTDATPIKVVQDPKLGILATVTLQQHECTIWLPSSFSHVRFDKNKRISTYQESLQEHQWEISPFLQFRFRRLRHQNGVFTVPYALFQDANGRFFDELSNLFELERRLYLKSNWFFARTPADIWNYLINGSIYDPRSLPAVGKSFRCQQCAYAWWNYFGFLHRETGKTLYDLMQDEIAYSVLLDLSSDGEWGHGFWSDDFETHTRFHIDGVHLLISQYEKSGEQFWIEAAERAMRFVFTHLTEKLDDESAWFLHDTLEHDNKSKPHRFQSTVFGKTVGNSLCINTHVQALTALHRLRVTIPHSRVYGEMFEKGAKALHKVLDHQPAEPLHRLLRLWIRKNTVRSSFTQSKSLKALNFLERRIISTIYWSICRTFPRIVHPDGFIERDLTLSMASDNYHLVNLKDLLILYQQKKFDWLRPYILDGSKFLFNFIDNIGLRNAILRSPYYVELLDVLHLYNKLIEPLPAERMSCVEEDTFKQTGGFSLDYYASELIHGSYHEPTYHS